MTLKPLGDAAVPATGAAPALTEAVCSVSTPCACARRRFVRTHRSMDTVAACFDVAVRRRKPRCARFSGGRLVNDYGNGAASATNANATMLGSRMTAPPPKTEPAGRNASRDRS